MAPTSGYEPLLSILRGWSTTLYYVGMELLVGNDPTAFCLPCRCATFAPQERVIGVEGLVRQIESCEMREPYRENH